MPIRHNPALTAAAAAGATAAKVPMSTEEADVTLREAARQLLDMRQQHPAAFSRVCRFLTDEDIETLKELAEDD